MLGQAVLARVWGKTPWIMKGATANHDAVGAGLSGQLETMLPVTHVAIAEDERLRRQLVAQFDGARDFLPAGWYFTHFASSAGMDGQGGDVLAQQMRQPFGGVFVQQAD